MPSLTLILLVVVVGALALIPTRRLYLAGFSPTVLTTYFLFMIGMGLLVAELRGPSRFLVPVLVVAYLAPFVAGRDGVAAFRAKLGGRGPTAGGGRDRRGNIRRPPMKNVTPPDERSGDERQAG